MIRVTVDTTTLVSGFVRPGPPPGRLVTAWQQRLFTLVIAEPLIAEVARTLRKPYFAMALSPAQIHRYVVSESPYLYSSRTGEKISNARLSSRARQPWGTPPGMT